jgi:hypothetical protein
MKGLVVWVVATLVCGTSTAAAQHQGHAGHNAVHDRGTKAMGFDQSRATHRFRLTPDGGRIEIAVNSKSDDETRTRIQSHLEHIAQRFKSGDFAIPVETHAEMPDGAKEMARFTDAITYDFEPTELGGRLKITTQNHDALEAIHAFLRYQIREHKTGDPTTVVR